MSVLERDMYVCTTLMLELCVLLLCGIQQQKKDVRHKVYHRQII